jgi:hypothetical protein
LNDFVALYNAQVKGRQQLQNCEGDEVRTHKGILGDEEGAASRDQL